MGNSFNYEATLQILSDILGYGGYHGESLDDLKARPRLKEQPKDIGLYVSADDMFIPASKESGLDGRLVLGTLIKSLELIVHR